jgi:C1A family cysteine protease
LATAEAATLAVTWSDCGAKHATVTDLQPTTVHTGATETVTGSGTVDEDVTSAHFKATVSALGAQLTSCQGDGTKDIVCTLPGGVGKITVKALSFPLKAGTVSIPVEVQTSSLIPASLANVDIHIAATEQAGEDVICLDVHTAKQMSATDVWEEFKAKYGKVYNGADHEAEHRQVYEANMAANEAHNAQGLSWTQGENQFTDLTQEQYRVAAGLGWKPFEEVAGAMPILSTHTHAGEELADSVDWTTKGAVTPIKDQGQCGSCWSFGTTGGIEGSWQIATGSLKSLSEQQLVDCSKFPNMGCSGGNPQIAVGFETKHNVCSEETYPYTATKGSCKGDTSCTAAIPSGGVTGYNSVTSNKNSMMSAVQQQPVTIAIEADQSSFQHYTGGVLSSGCGTQLDHAVLAVGYGTDSGNDYWLVKNSWGTSWGDAGYIKIGSATNQCGVLNQAGYPSVSASVSV